MQIHLPLLFKRNPICTKFIKGDIVKPCIGSVTSWKYGWVEGLIIGVSKDETELEILSVVGSIERKFIDFADNLMIIIDNQ